MDVYRFLVLPGSRIVVSNEHGEEVVVEVHQEFEAQATQTVQIRASQQIDLEPADGSC